MEEPDRAKLPTAGGKSNRAAGGGRRFHLPAPLSYAYLKVHIGVLFFIPGLEKIYI
jgi:hypothetical protein